MQALPSTTAKMAVIVSREGQSAETKPGRAGQRIGAAKRKFVVPETIDADEATIAELFGNGPTTQAVARDC